MWLIGKIITESRDRLKALQIFKKEQLERLFNNFVIPEHKKRLIEPRFLALKYILQDEKTKIKALEWNI